jgi:hypothetical protein
MIIRTHKCDELKAEQKREEDTEITVAGATDNWFISLFDGDMVKTKIKYCPYCGEALTQ